MDVKMYLNNIREKNEENSLKYNKMISEVSYITKKEELDKVKEILKEIREDNKDLYDYVISLLKRNSNLEEIYLLYKEYKEAKLREEILANEIKAKDIEFANIKEDLSSREDNIKEFDDIAKELKTTGKILDDLRVSTEANLNITFNKLEKEESSQLSFGSKALLALGSFLSFKNNHNVIGTLLATYLSYRILRELSFKNTSYIDLCNDYINSLEEYYDNAKNIEESLISNLDNIEKVEEEIKSKYSNYIKNKEFVMIFELIDDIKDSVNDSLKEIDKTKDNIDRSIDEGREKIKVLV